MKSKHLYNYKRALNVPFMVQKLTKGFSLTKAIPITMFATFGVSILLMFTLLRPVFTFFDVIPGLKLATQLMFPFGVTYLYHNVEPDGLKIHEYVIDLFSYFYTFQFGKKKIYQEQIIDYDETEKLVFENIK